MYKKEDSNFTQRKRSTPNKSIQPIKYSTPKEHIAVIITVANLNTNIQITTSI